MKYIYLAVLRICSVILLFFAAQTVSLGQIISSYVGGNGDGLSPATIGKIDLPNAVACDNLGNLYVAERYRVRKINLSTGEMTTVAGTGYHTNVLVTGLAKYARLGEITGLAADAAGSVYIAHEYFVVKVDASGMMTHVAGSGSISYSGDGGLATLAGMRPQGIALDAAGNIFISTSNRIRKINSSGIITTVAGTGGWGYSGDGGPATAAEFSRPTGICVDNAGNIYVSDHDNSKVRKINTAGIISTVLAYPQTWDVKTDAAGNVYVANASIGAIRRIASSGVAVTIAGNGSMGFSGDGGPATAAALNAPYSFDFDNAGNMYIADRNNHRIRKVSASGIITTIGGNGKGSTADGVGGSMVALNQPSSVVSDISGNLYFVDGGSAKIRKVNTAGMVHTIAGNGIIGYLGDGGPATAASIIEVLGLAADNFGNIYAADNGSRHIRKIHSSGIISTIAGGGTSGAGDGGPATSAIISPNDVATDDAGNIYFSESSNHKIRKVSIATGIVSTVIGTGEAGYSGDNGIAVAAKLNTPSSIAFDRRGNMYVLDQNRTRIRKIDATGKITTVGAGLLSVPAAEGVPATYASFSANKICADKYGNVYLSTGTSAQVYMIDTFGFIKNLVGNGVQGYMGDGFNGKDAELWEPRGVAVDTAGNLSVSDIYGVIRRLCCVGSNINHPPLFTHNTPYPFFVCGSSGPASVDTLLKVKDVNATDVLTWSVITPPAHGTLSGFPASVSSSGGFTQPTGTSFTPAAGYSGSDFFVIKVTDGKAITAMRVNVTIIATPSVAIFGSSQVCATDSILLTGSPAGGIWSGSSASASVSAAGRVYGLSAGTATISYTVAGACATVTQTLEVTVNPLPTAGVISGPSVLCEGSSITLTNPATGGTWSSASPFVSVGASTGMVIGYASGTATISYRRTNICGTATATVDVLVSDATYPGTISGTTSLCVGGSSMLTSSVSGGVWSSSVPSIAIIGTGGTVTAHAAGATIISYTVTGACGSATALAIVNVTSATPIGPITGASALCTGTDATLSHSSAGGTWSSSNPAVASVSSTGEVTAHTAGIVIISYTASLGCGVSTAVHNLMVQSTPITGTLTGPATLCEGATSVVSSTVSGGSWSSGSITVTVGPTGIVTGVAAGAASITYTLTNTCGTATGVYSVSVYAAPNAGTISGVPVICAGSTATFSNSVSGGTWSTSNAAVASVGSGTGVLTSIGGGTATVMYTSATGCGTATTSYTLTVNAPSAGIITGVTSVCAGATATLSSTVSGGSWASSNPSVATVAPTGIVTTYAGGVAVISYSVTTGCGGAVSTAVFTVGSLPIVSPITGSTSLCAGTTAVLANATLGGSWSSSNTAVATISSSGVVSGIAGGTAVISYLVTAGCGATGVTYDITVNTVPSSPAIAGTTGICETASSTLSATAAGGWWTSSSPAVASVGASSGVLTGVTSGASIITYTVVNSCGSAFGTRSVTVNPLPDAVAVFGPSSVCEGAAITLSATAAGGVWTGSSTAALVGVLTGIVSGGSAGTTTISYMVTNGCGTAVATKGVTVNPLPAVDTISGAAMLCLGSSSLYANSIGGGIWLSSAPSVVSVSSAGIVSATGSGSASLLYILTTACGSATATKAINVATPIAGPITGIATVCIGEQATLAGAVTGGVWESGTEAVATIDGDGVVSAHTPGSTVITYSVTDACGTASATVLFTVGSLPNVSPISGASVICAANSATLANATAGGVWSSSNMAVATVSAGGLLIGITAGTAVVSYAVAAGCGTSVALLHVTVESMPVVAAITGKNRICKGQTTVLSADLPFGYWGSSNSALASIDSGGKVTAFATGGVYISYVIINSCGSATATFPISLETVPDAGYITGGSGVCAGSKLVLTSSLPNGMWSSAGSSAVVTSLTNFYAEVTGVSDGNAVISYTIANACGSSSARYPIHVYQVPSVGVIMGDTIVEAGYTISLSNAIAGGVWSSATPAIAAIGNSGVVLGLNRGVALIQYSVTNSFGCNVSVDKQIAVVDGSIERGMFELFPNPAKNSLIVRWTNQYARYADMTITNSLGQVVRNGVLNMPLAEGQTTIDVAELLPGTYFINIKYAGDYFSAKIQIVK